MTGPRRRRWPWVLVVGGGGLAWVLVAKWWETPGSWRPPSGRTEPGVGAASPDWSPPLPPETELAPVFTEPLFATDPAAPARPSDPEAPPPAPASVPVAARVPLGRARWDPIPVGLALGPVTVQRLRLREEAPRTIRVHYANTAGRTVPVKVTLALLRGEAVLALAVKSATAEPGSEPGAWILRWDAEGVEGKVRQADAARLTLHPR